MSIQTEREVEQPVPEATSAIGIDLGIARFATLSDGSFFEPLSSFKQHEVRLARYTTLQELVSETLSAERRRLGGLLAE